VQSDPIGFASGPLSIYGYVEQNSFNYNDATGLSVALDGSVHSMTSATNYGGVISGVIVGVSAVTGGILANLRMAGQSDNVPMVIFQDPQGPGDCSAAFHKRLQDRIDVLKDTPHSCSGNTDPFTRLSRAHTAGQLWVVRSLINNICYRGGDPTHQKAAADARRAQMRCLGF